MQLKDLRTFHKLAELGNMHSAATALGVTQPALSKAVRRLEDDLSVRLFERTARGVALTALGRALYARNLTLTQLVDDIRTELNDLRTGQSGQLRIGTVPALVDSVVADSLCSPIARGLQPVLLSAATWQLPIGLFWRRAAYVSLPMRSCRDDIARRFGARTAEAELGRRPGGAAEAAHPRR